MYRFCWPCQITAKMLKSRLSTNIIWFNCSKCDPLVRMSYSDFAHNRVQLIYSTYYTYNKKVVVSGLWCVNTSWHYIIAATLTNCIQYWYKNSKMLKEQLLLRIATSCIITHFLPMAASNMQAIISCTTLAVYG